MIEFYVSGQRLRVYTPVIAADTLNYLTAKVNFSDTKWDGYSKWLHFRQEQEENDLVYDIALDENDEITADDALNLTIGEWEIYLTGTKDSSRLTTVPLILTVKESGLIDAPLHPIVLSTAEQIDSKASQALLFAQYVKDQADSGAFNGRDGTSFKIIAYYDTLEEMEAAVTNPDTGDAYGIGTEPPYNIYVWDSLNVTWVNNGPIQGSKGDDGNDGTTFTPSVDASGNLTWTNDGGKTNPTARNIMGPQGIPGQDGADGTDTFAIVQEYGYEGTEATFYAALSMMPFHNARHLPGGSDPITVMEGNIYNGAVTTSKLGANAVTQLYAGELDETNWTPSSKTETLLLSPDGSTTEFNVPGSPTELEYVRNLNTDPPTDYTSGTDYTYTDGKITFTTAPAAGTNSIRVAWLVDAAPYTQALSVTGMLSTDRIIVDADVSSATVDEAEAILEAWGSVYRAVAADGVMTFYAFETPEVAIPIQILGVRR